MVIQIHTHCILNVGKKKIKKIVNGGAGVTYVPYGEDIDILLHWKMNGKLDRK